MFTAPEPRGHVMRHFRKAIIASRILMLIGMSMARPAAAATFDGAWNVQIASSNGACPSRAGVSIGIRDGQVASGNGMFTASGHVAEAGAISVILISGMKRAVGDRKSTRLNSSHGS